jgi:hypothetical protein
MTAMGICGDNCLYCPRYLATRSGKAEQLEKVRELWARLGLRDPAFPAKDLVCNGCIPENNCAYPELRTCVYEKGIESCGLCEAYPCRLVSAAFEKSEKLRSRSVSVCTPKEVELLQKTFFSKRKNLEKKRFEKQEKARAKA